ncbi:MAG: hydroxymethylglutaryl-CoA lyase [Pedobacter sp.]|nr:MAG: hydroxymethylglutaryl-CoA lyase [Pedobacter sp.]
MKVIECPRDAMQGLAEFIPTHQKIEYLNLLLQVGFDTLDFGSFVSPKAIPQMADTAEVLAGLDLTHTTTKLLAIVANLKGVEQALSHPEISYLGYPFSISETFQQRNTNASIESSLLLVENLLNRCSQQNKQAVIYLSMGFGNPYGDDWSPELVAHWTQELANRGATIIALSDTTGMSTPESIESLLNSLIPAFEKLEIGVHLHSLPNESRAKIKAAYQAGCKRFDAAILGFGGCPMASDSLTGNIDTQILIETLTAFKDAPTWNATAWQKSLAYANTLFK